jgi:hypothetical protein
MQTRQVFRCWFNTSRQPRIIRPMNGRLPTLTMPRRSGRRRRPN